MPFPNYYQKALDPKMVTEIILKGGRNDARRLDEDGHATRRSPTHDQPHAPQYG